MHSGLRRLIRRLPMILIDWLLKVMRAVADIATGSKRRRLKAPRADLEEGALLVEESAEQLRNLEVGVVISKNGVLR